MAELDTSRRFHCTMVLILTVQSHDGKILDDTTTVLCYIRAGLPALLLEEAPFAFLLGGDVIVCLF